MFRKRGDRKAIVSTWCAGKKAIRSDPSFDGKVLVDAMEAYARSKGESPAEAGRRRGRAAGLSRLLKWAALPAAAAILLFLLNPFGETGVAWGKVVERIEKAPTLLLHASTFMQQDSIESHRALVSEFRMYVSREAGVRVDMLSFGKEVGRLYISPDKKSLTSIDNIKGKIEHHVNPEPGEGPYLSDPKREVRELLSRPYEKIGGSTIDGKKVEGIETRVEKRVPGAVDRPGEFVAERLWVEIVTGLPLRKESIRKLFGNISMVNVSDFKWNVPLDSAFFQVPEEPLAPGKK
ncbi:MAG: hypothetical protein NTZ26_06590 [Candidatus Aminicenantes bacterium]|nr:hypothetical protein [Candidatus Aminicenantes bacterium]